MTVSACPSDGLETLTMPEEKLDSSIAQIPWSKTSFGAMTEPLEVLPMTHAA